MPIDESDGLSASRKRSPREPAKILSDERKSFCYDDIINTKSVDIEDSKISKPIYIRESKALNGSASKTHCNNIRWSHQSDKWAGDIRGI